MATQIRKAGSRLHRSLENFLVYAQIELVASDPEKISMLREERTRKSLALMKNVGGQRDVLFSRPGDLRVEGGNTEPAISSVYLTKILEELIDNAFKFSNSGSHVIVRSEKMNGQFVLSVGDKGSGMTVEQIDSVGA